MPLSNKKKGSTITGFCSLYTIKILWWIKNLCDLDIKVLRKIKYTCNEYLKLLYKMLNVDLSYSKIQKKVKNVSQIHIFFYLMELFIQDK